MGTFTLDLTWVYLMRDKTTGHYKIGRSDDPHARLKTLQKQATKQPTPNDYELIEAWWCKGQEEKNLHVQFSRHRVRGEWFKMSDDDLTRIYERFFRNQKLSDHEGYLEHLKVMAERCFKAEDMMRRKEEQYRLTNEQIAHVEARNKRLVYELEQNNDCMTALRTELKILRGTTTAEIDVDRPAERKTHSLPQSRLSVLPSLATTSAELQEIAKHKFNG